MGRMDSAADEPRGSDHPAGHRDVAAPHFRLLQGAPAAPQIPGSPTRHFPRASLHRRVARFLRVPVGVFVPASFGRQVLASMLRCARASAVYLDAASTAPGTRKHTCSSSRGNKY